MPQIILETIIHSTIDICFDLSRSIDLHQVSTVETKEKAVDGKTSGLISLGESVTWQATHFGIIQRLTSKITQFKRPFHFRDEQVKGAFRYFVHDHQFETAGDTVIMRDIFTYGSPYGFAGRVFNTLILTNHLKKLLTKRNAVIKEYAESDKWKEIIAGTPR